MHLHLGETDHDRVTAAVAKAEKDTDGEIVTIVARQSDAYHDAGLHWAVGATFLGLSLAAAFPAHLRALASRLLNGWGHDLPDWQVLTVLLGLLILLFLLVRYALAWTPLRMALTPAATKTRRVHRRAMALFRAVAQGRTRGRTGVLIYLSLDEHRAEIVADSAINEKVSAETWGAAMAALVDAVRGGRPGDGMAAAVEQVGVVLAAHFPKSHDNPNELPDRLIEI